MHQEGAFAIPAINNYIPEKWKPYIFILFVIIFQFSGGVYLATVNAMVGGTALMQEDILMAGCASLVGMALTFIIMLRLKMRFTSKVSLLTCCFVLIVSNLICVSTTNVVVLVATCFFAGIFRMWATFECNSTIQLWLTPKRDLSVFFCFVYLLVQGCILTSGNTNLYVALFSNWHYMHWLVIGALLFVVLCVILLFNNKQYIPRFPLSGIDWLGALLWGLILLSINFICIYGEHYDWWYSTEIRTASVMLMLMLALNIWRASFIRHPYVALPTFKYKAVYLTFLLYIVIDLFLAPTHFVEQIYFENILNYDTKHLISLNWIEWIGAITGAAFTYHFFALKKHSYKSMFMIGFSSILAYLLLMYFLIDYQTTEEMMAAPLFFRNFGYVVIAIVLLTNLIKVPFHHFFQAVSVQAFVSAGFGGVLGTAVIQHIFKIIATSNFQFITSNIDNVNKSLFRVDTQSIDEIVQRQVLLVSSKELYGDLVIFGIGCFVLFILYRYPYLPTKTYYPKMRTIKKMLKKEVCRS